MAIIWNPQSELLREPNLLVPGKKPVGSVRPDWSSSLLRECIILQDLNGSVHNYAHGEQPTVIGAGVYGAGPNGTFLELHYDDEVIDYTFDVDDNFSTTEFTAAIIRRRTDLTEEHKGTMFGCADAGTGARFQSHNAWAGTGVVYFDFGGSTGSNRVQFNHTENTNYEKWTYRAGPMGLSIWLDGVEMVSNAVAASRDAFGLANTFQVNDQLEGPQNEAYDAEYYMVLVCNRAWTDAEIVDWASDPYQVFVPA